MRLWSNQTRTFYGNLTITALNGQAITLFGSPNNYTLAVTANATTGQSLGAVVSGGTNSTDFALKINNQSGATLFMAVYGDGGVTIGNTTDQGPGTLNVLSGLYLAGNPIYQGVPVNTQTVSYVGVLSDQNKGVVMNSASALTFTIPANASVAYPNGTMLTVFNFGAANVTIAISSDTLYFANGGSTGSRTLAPKGVATMWKFSATNWVISGTGLT